MNRTASMKMTLLVLAAGTALAGCHRKPAGQVVATVDGQEVTRRDLLEELRAVGGRSEADLNAAQAKLTEALVDRKLLVLEAKREKLDKNPAFLAAEKRQQDLLLASMLAQTFSQRIQKPTPAAVKDFIAANPQMFGSRKLYQVSEIAAPSKGISAQELAPLHGQQAVADYLNRKKIPFRARTATLDTLSLPKPLVDKFATLPPGEPMAIANGDGVVFTTILASKDAPVPAAQQQAVAERALMQQTAGKQLEDEVKQLRGQADIKYLPGFAPAAAPK